MVIAPEFMKQFRCAGAECPDTCCKGWNMQLTDADYEKYREKAPDLLNAVSGGSGNYIMRRDPGTDYCIKFTDGLCGIQQEYGEEFLGKACNLYPRMFRALGEKIEMAAALSCPEVARLALFSDSAFGEIEEIDHLPTDTKDYLPQSLSPSQATMIHNMFIDAALAKDIAPERVLMRIFAVSESLERISIDSWADAVPFYLEHADSALPAPEAKETDKVYLLQSLCGLIFASRRLSNPRLMQTVTQMEQALHVKIKMDDLAIVPLPDSMNAVRQLSAMWLDNYRNDYTDLLRRYLAMQLSLALFPFCGFGNSLTERIAIIGVRFATVKLGLMSACSLSAAKLPEDEVIRVVQSISRFMDHLAEPEFSLKIYQETGWLQKARLMALVGDGD